jgi:MFS transporter, ACS family, tartrate transporter
MPVRLAGGLSELSRISRICLQILRSRSAPVMGRTPFLPASVDAMTRLHGLAAQKNKFGGSNFMATTSIAATGAARSTLEASTIRAISWRLIPFLVLAYFFSYLDRVNLGFAALTMNAELKFSPTVFAWGAGIFFIGYFIFEVPSNLALEKFGASRWIARIMVTWGIISALMASVSGETSFYLLRFLLGVAEAGFFPGIILYLTYWYPAEYRARFLAAFAIAVPVSTVIGAPISGLLLGLDGAMGLKGWQWLFIIEGVPSVLLGIATWFYLTDRPEHADWLTSEQKAWLAGKLDAEIAAKQAVKHLTLGEALSSPKVITLSLIYFGFVGALYGMQFWLPQIVKAFGLTNAQTGFVTAIPYLFGTIAMILWARHSDASRERVIHVGAPLLLTAAALGVSSYISDPAMTMVVLTVAAIGVFCTFAVFWTLPTAWLSGTAAAGAIALINSIGNLAGFGGPYLIGWVKEATGNTSSGLLVLAVLPLIGGLLVFLGGHESRAEFASSDKAG